MPRSSKRLLGAGATAGRSNSISLQVRPALAACDEEAPLAAADVQQAAVILQG
jgi:hypothetical protein